MKLYKIVSRLLLLGIVFYAGLSVGEFKVLNELGDYKYSELQPDEKHNFNPNRTVDYEGTIYVGNYTIHFQTEEQNKHLNGSTIGYTYPGDEKEIWIETGHSAAEIESTCDHEVFHELFPRFRHSEGEAKFSDPIYKYSDDARIWECDLAVQVALAKQ